MTASHTLDLLAELRRHALVFPRYRAVLPDGTVKGVQLADALAAVAERGGTVEHAEMWLLPTRHEVLGPWLPYVDSTVPTDANRGASMIEKLKKKPITVETMLWDGTSERAEQIRAWVGYQQVSWRDRPAAESEPGFVSPVKWTEPHELAQLWVAHNRSWSPLPVGYRVAKELDGSGYYPLSPDGARAGYEEPTGGWPS